MITMRVGRAAHDDIVLFEFLILEGDSGRAELVNDS